MAAPPPLASAFVDFCKGVGKLCAGGSDEALAPAGLGHLALDSLLLWCDRSMQPTSDIDGEVLSHAAKA